MGINHLKLADCCVYYV